MPERYYEQHLLLPIGYLAAMERSAKWLQENAHLVLDAVVDAIVTIDDRGTIQSTNRAVTRLFGYTEAELIGQPVTVLMPEPHRSAHGRYLTTYLETRVPTIIGIGRELEAVAKDGRLFPIYLAISEIQAEGHAYFAGIIRDLSQQKASEAALLEQRERVAKVGRLSTMGEMTASIAHEINQPLTAISMYAQAAGRMTASTTPDVEKLGEVLAKLNVQALRAGSVIERIQRMVKHEDGVRQRVDINDLVMDLGNLVQGDARLHDVRLVFELDPDAGEALCDPVQVQQVGLNLIRNAIDAMWEIELIHGNVITVSTARVGANIEISVCDQGPGIDPLFADRVFGPFHTTKSDGMGMGLSICRSIVEDHYGSLVFRSNDAHGATFVCSLPAD